MTPDEQESGDSVLVSPGCWPHNNPDYTWHLERAY